MSELILTLNCLKASFTEKNNQERKKAEAKLFELRNFNFKSESDFLNHICAILEILKSDELDTKMKISVVVYLKNILKQKIEEKNFNKQDLLNILRMFIELYLSEHLSDQLMQNLNLSLNDILNSGLVDESIEELINYLFLFSGQINKFKPILYLIQLIISSSSTKKSNITSIISKEIQILENIINTLNQTNSKEMKMLIDV